MDLRVPAWPALLSMVFSPLLSAQIVVSPTGNDNATGSIGAPIRTLEHAVQLARTAPGHVVVLQGGTYRLASPVILTSADSGLVLRAAAGQQAVVSGGLQLKGWKSNAAKPGLWSTALPLGAPMPRQIYINGVRASRTRGRLPAALTMNDVGSLRAPRSIYRDRNRR